jgi:hypothetical protein
MNNVAKRLFCQPWISLESLPTVLSHSELLLGWVPDVHGLDQWNGLLGGWVDSCWLLLVDFWSLLGFDVYNLLQ